MATSRLRVGEKVILVGIPPDLPNRDELSTQTTFERCLGKAFVVESLNPLGWAELCVESVTGSVGETIYVEPEFLEPVKKTKKDKTKGKKLPTRPKKAWDKETSNLTPEEKLLRRIFGEKP